MKARLDRTVQSAINAAMGQGFIIIGGGLMGITSLYELAQRGHDAVLLETSDALGNGASHANGGVLHPSLPDPWNNPGIGRILLSALFNRHAPIRMGLGELPRLWRFGFEFIRYSSPAQHRTSTLANYALAAYSLAETQALTQKLGLSYEQANLHHEAPTVKLFSTQKALARGRHLADMLAAQGLAYEAWTPAELAAHEPALAATAPSLAGALAFPNDQIGNALLFLQQLAEAARAAGGDIRLNTQAVKLLRENGRVTGVQLANGDRLTGTVILANGHAAPALAKPCGLPLSIRPAKGYSITLPNRTKNAPTSARLTHPLVDDARHIAMTPLGDKLRILGMAEFIGADTTLNAARLQILRQFLTDLLPDMAAEVDWAKTDNWAGLRPMHSSGRPRIGASGMAGLWLNCGHGHLGWTMAVGSAKILADLIEGRVPAVAPAPFKP